MKALVIYKTVTGNTKKVADAIYSSLSCKKEIKQIFEVDELTGYDVYFICTPIMNMGPDEQIKKFLTEKTLGKKVALVINHGAPKDFSHLKNWLDQFKDTIKDAQLLGMFDCQGEISDAAKNFFLKSKIPDLIELAKLKEKTIGKPDKISLKKAQDFAKEIIEKLS